MRSEEFEIPPFDLVAELCDGGGVRSCVHLQGTEDFGLDLKLFRDLLDGLFVGHLVQDQGHKEPCVAQEDLVILDLLQRINSQWGFCLRHDTCGSS